MIYNGGKYNQHWSTKKLSELGTFPEEYQSIDQEMIQGYLKMENIL